MLDSIIAIYIVLLSSADKNRTIYSDDTLKTYLNMPWKARFPGKRVSLGDNCFRKWGLEIFFWVSVLK